MDLDLRLTEATFNLNLIERAIHDRHGWSCSWGDVSVPVERTRLDDGVLITATFPPSCHLVRPDLLVTFVSDGDIFLVRPLDGDPGDGGFCFEMTLTVDTEKAEA